MGSAVRGRQGVGMSLAVHAHSVTAQASKGGWAHAALSGPAGLGVPDGAVLARVPDGAVRVELLLT